MLLLLSEAENGTYAAAVASKLKTSRSRVAYYMKELRDDRLIVEDRARTEFWRRSLGAGASLKIFSPTKKGWQLLEGNGHAERSNSLTSPSRGAEKRVQTPSQAQVEVHNFRVRFPIKRMSIAYLPQVAKMNNWVRKYDTNFHGVFLEATPKHIILAAKGTGPDLRTARALCLADLIRVQQLLETAYGCELGPPDFQEIYAPGRTKVGVQGLPLAKGLPYQKGKLATIDDTPEEGTIHPVDPNDADRIVSMARRVEDTHELVQGLSLQAISLGQALEVLVKLTTPPAALAPSIDERRDVT